MADLSVSNLVSNLGVIGSDVTGVGTARVACAATTYGSNRDKAIMAYGLDAGDSYLSVSNLVSNVGVVSSDTTGVGTARAFLAGAAYGDDKGIFGYGGNGSNQSMTNLVSNVGVIGSDVSGVGTARHWITACSYGGDKAIFAYGTVIGLTAVSNLVSNSGVVATDVSGVGTARSNSGGLSYSI